MNDRPLAAGGRSYLAIPGPSVIPDAVLEVMHRTPPNIYHGPLVEITESLIPDLRAIARTRHNVAMYIGNGHAVWEASLANVIAPGDHVLVLATGRFGFGWADTAAGLGAEVQIIDFGQRSPIDVQHVAEKLTADRDFRIKAVLAVFVDTATGILNDMAALRQTLDAARHPALLMADCIASLGCDRFEMDAWGVDVMVTGSQKGLMVPPGLGFVFFNEKAAAIRNRMVRVSRYWDWRPRSAPESFYQYWYGTAPTQHVYGLRTALDMIKAEGLENVWARHRLLARAIWRACEIWGEAGPLEINAPDPGFRSHAVTALRLAPSHTMALRDWVERHLNLTLGIGLGMTPQGALTAHDLFRIGHMGHVSGHMVMGLLGGIEAGMKALGIPHGSGALSAAAAVIAAGDDAP